MRITRTILATVLAASLLFSLACNHSKVNVDPMAQVNELHKRASRLQEIWAPAVIKAIDTFLADAAVQADAKAVKLLTDTRKLAVEFQNNIVPLVDLVATLSTLDLTNRADLQAKLKPIRNSWDALSPLLGEINTKIAALFTDNPVIQQGVRLAPQAIDVALGYIDSEIQ